MFELKSAVAVAALAISGLVTGWGTTTAQAAVTTGTLVGVYDGNDPCPEPGGGKNDITAFIGGAFCLAKFDSGTVGAGDENGKVPDGAGIDMTDNFTLTGGGTNGGKFSFDDQGEGYSLTHLVLKAGNAFAVFDLGGAISGEWFTAPHLANPNNGNGRDISHISFYGTTGGIAPVPLPAAGLLLVGALGGLSVMRRRKARAA